MRATLSRMTRLRLGSMPEPDSPTRCPANLPRLTLGRRLPIKFVLAGTVPASNRETNPIHRRYLLRHAGQNQTRAKQRPRPPVEPRRPWRRASERGVPGWRGAARASPRRSIRGPRPIHVRMRLRLRGSCHDLGRLPALHAHPGLVSPPGAGRNANRPSSHRPRVLTRPVRVAAPVPYVPPTPAVVWPDRCFQRPQAESNTFTSAWYNRDLWQGGVAASRADRVERARDQAASLLRGGGAGRADDARRQASRACPARALPGHGQARGAGRREAARAPSTRGGGHAGRGGVPREGAGDAGGDGRHAGRRPLVGAPTGGPAPRGVHEPDPSDDGRRVVSPLHGRASVDHDRVAAARLPDARPRATGSATPTPGSSGSLPPGRAWPASRSGPARWWSP